MNDADLVAELRALGDALFAGQGAKVAHRTLALAGLDTHLVEAGERGAPAVVLLHGASGGGADWYTVVPRLARRCHVIAVDLPGFGESAAPGWDPRGAADGFAAWTGALLDALAPPGGAVLAGNSLGGYVAIAAFAARPQHVRGIVLAGAPPGPPPRPHGGSLAMLAIGTAALAALALGPPRALHERAHRRMVLADVAAVADYDRLVDYAWTATRRPAFRAFLRSARGLFTAEGMARIGASLEKARAQALPLLVVHGAGDRLFPLDAARKATAAFPSARFLVLDGAGHVPFLERPDAFCDAMLAWLP